MKKANVIKFSMDLPRVSDEVFKKLIRLGSYENMGFDERRWTFPISHIKDVEDTICDRVIFSMKHLREHIIEIDTDRSPNGQIFIEKDKDASMKKETLKMKRMVYDILAENRMSRNSDMWLYFKVLERKGYVIDADYKMITSLPSYETVSRIRRKIQNGFKLFRADDEVIGIRKDNELDMREINKWFE